jgi:MoxR-like ATPase
MGLTTEPPAGSPAAARFRTIDDVERVLREQRYLPDRGLAAAILLAVTMGRPLLLEGEVGVGKTEVAKTLQRILGAELIRLQCYEGLDASQALYEWDYARQLLYARLLIDEIDRADEEFEAFLLEVLSDFSVSVPELGTIAATDPPVVILTSNRTRELHDALKRRCLYHWIGFPSVDQEVAIIRMRAPGVSEALAASVATVVARLRGMDLVKPPGSAEAIDWAQALSVLGAESVEGEAALLSLGWVVKNRDDLRRVEPTLAQLVAD